MPKRIVISRGAELLRLPEENLIYVSAEGNYSTAVTKDGRSHLLTFQLGQIEDMLGEQLGDKGMHFIRLGRGLIINTDYIFLIDVSKQKLVLSDGDRVYHELSASKEVLSKFKAYIESQIKNQDGE